MSAIIWLIQSKRLHLHDNLKAKTKLQSNMRRTNISKSILILAVLLICNLVISAASPRNYMYDTKEENGKIMSKVVFLNNDGLLSKEFKYEFTYNENGKVASKTAYRWDKSNDEWQPYYQSAFTYTDKGEIHVVYGMWDKNKKSYDLNVQQLVLADSSYNDIFS